MSRSSLRFVLWMGVVAGGASEALSCSAEGGSGQTRVDGGGGAPGAAGGSGGTGGLGGGGGGDAATPSPDVAAPREAVLLLEPSNEMVGSDRFTTVYPITYTASVREPDGATRRVTATLSGGEPYGEWSGATFRAQPAKLPAESIGVTTRITARFEGKEAVANLTIVPRRHELDNVVFVPFGGGPTPDHAVVGGEIPAPEGATVWTEVTLRLVSAPTAPAGFDPRSFISLVKAMRSDVSKFPCTYGLSVDATKPDRFVSVPAGSSACFDLRTRRNERYDSVAGTAQFIQVNAQVIGSPGDVKLVERRVVFVVPPTPPLPR